MRPVAGRRCGLGRNEGGASALRRGAAARFAASAAAKGESRLLLSDAFTNPEHIHYALKTTVAAMFCYFTFTLLDWPGIHTCLITCYIVSLGTTGETVEKLTLRILGCMLGAAAGIAAIVFLMPYLTSIGALMVVVFLATLGAGWIAGGSPRIAYAGFQIAFAFFLCVIEGSSPAFDMTTVRDRVIGILFGNVVVYLLFANIWPVTVARRIDTGIAALLQHLGAMMTAMSRSQRSLLASEATAALGTIEQDLMLARYEPASVRPTNDWLNARRRTLDAIAGLIAPLLLRANQYPSLSGALSQQLGGLAGSFGGHSQEGSAASSGLTDELVAADLQAMERALALRPAEAGVANHAPA